MSIKHRNQILDTLSGLVSDIKQPVEKALSNLTQIVCDFNHERLITSIEKRKKKETNQKPSEIIIDIKEIGEHEKR